MYLIFIFKGKEFTLCKIVFVDDQEGNYRVEDRESINEFQKELFTPIVIVKNRKIELKFWYSYRRHSGWSISLAHIFLAYSVKD